MQWTTNQRLITIAGKMLEELFHSRTPIGGGSQTGAQLARLELFGTTKRCPACARFDRREERWLKERRAYLEAWARAGEPPPVPYELLPGCSPPEPPTHCRRCDGIGFVPWYPSVELTARPKGSSVPTGATLTEFSTSGAEASIVMRRFSAARPDLRDVLTAYHGLAGDYAESNCGSRLMAIVPLTEVYRLTIEPTLGQVKRKKRTKRKATSEPVVPEEPRLPKYVERFAGEHPQAKRLVADDVARWLEHWKSGRLSFSARAKPPEPRTLGPNARVMSAGEVLLSEVHEWRTAALKAKREIWDIAEFQAEMLLETATVVWEQWVERTIEAGKVET